MAWLAGLALAVLAAATAAPSMGANLNAPDKHFLMEAIMGSQSEVMLGHLAMKNGSSDMVKQFGQHMINDHSTAGNKFTRVAGRKHLAPPADVSVEAMKTYKRLAALSGDAFDRAYMQDMVADHVKDVRAFETAQKNCKDPELRKLAAATTPTLREHLAMARKPLAAVNGSMP
jgi:putative membrane protein